MIRSFFARLSLLFLLALAAPLPALAATKDALTGRVGIAAVVNDEAVTFSDLRNRVALMLLGAPGAPPPEVRKKIENQVLGVLIDERLQMQAAKTLGIAVDDAEVDAGFARIAANNKLEAEEFRRRLGAAGVNAATLRDKIRAEIAWGMVVRRKLRPQITVSESEIDSELDRLARGRGKTEYNVAEILLPVSSPDMDNLVREDAGKIVQQLTKGASFSQVARQFSQSPGAAQGGDLGWLQAEQMDPALGEAVSKMQPGQISPPVRTARGYHILFLRDRRAGGTLPAAAPAPRPAARPAAPAKPVAAKPAAAAAAGDIVHLMQLVIPIGENDPAPIVNAKISRAQSLKIEVSSCQNMAEKARDFLTPGTGDLGRGPVAKLPEPVRAAVEDLPEGELSAPVRIPGGVAVLMVCDRIEGAMPATAPEQAMAPDPEEAVPEEETAEAAPPPAPAAMNDESREQVANQIGMKRLEQMAERYLKDLRATAYIEKRL